MPLSNNRNKLHFLKGKGYRVWLQDFYLQSYLKFIALGESIGGPNLVPWLVAPAYGALHIYRKPDFAPFVRLREALPTIFCFFLGHRQHFSKMLQDWCETGGATISYPHLNSPEWKKRFEVKGTAPYLVPEWKDRPIILAFMHTGAFGILPYWMRAQGIPTVCLVGGLPVIATNHCYNKIIERGDRTYGLEGFPQIFQRSGALKEILRFLQPGRAMTIALDGGKFSPEFDRYVAGGFPILAKMGACRIAAQTNAVVVPVGVRRTARCRFEIRFGKAAPDALIQKEDFAGATQHLISELWQDIEKYPVDLNWPTLEALSPALKVKRRGWP